MGLLVFFLEERRKFGENLSETQKSLPIKQKVSI